MNILILCGPSGVGKTTLLSKVEHHVIPRGITTRPLRKGERLLTHMSPLPDLEYAERIEYDGYEYGIPASEFISNRAHVVVAGLEGIRQLRRFCNLVTVVYVRDKQLTQRRPIDEAYESALQTEADLVLSLKEAHEVIAW